MFAKRDNKEVITAEDVKNVSTIKGKGMGIKNLSGLEHCKALASIDLADNAIVDLKPLKDLKQLPRFGCKSHRKILG